MSLTSKSFFSNEYNNNENVDEKKKTKKKRKKKNMNKMLMIILVRMMMDKNGGDLSLASSRSLVVVLGQVQIEMYCVAAVSVVGSGAGVVYY